MFVHVGALRATNRGNLLLRSVVKYIWKGTRCWGPVRPSAAGATLGTWNSSSVAIEGFTGTSGFSVKFAGGGARGGALFWSVITPLSRSGHVWYRGGGYVTEPKTNNPAVRKTGRSARRMSYFPGGCHKCPLFVFSVVGLQHASLLAYVDFLFASGLALDVSVDFVFHENNRPLDSVWAGPRLARSKSWLFLFWNVFDIWTQVGWITGTRLEELALLA